MPDLMYKPEECPEHQFWLKSPRIKWVIPTSKCQLCGTIRKAQEQEE